MHQPLHDPQRTREDHCRDSILVHIVKYRERRWRAISEMAKVIKEITVTSVRFGRENRDM